MLLAMLAAATLAAPALGQTPFSVSGSVPSTWGWVQRAGAVPAARQTFGLAYDSLRARVVLFGGRLSGFDANDTWEYDGKNWTQKSIQSSPLERHAPTMTYDSARNRVVMFGGQNGGSINLNDTWEYDGSGWVQRNTQTAPAAGTQQNQMTFDAARRRVVLFQNGLTWEYDGTDWRQVTTPVSPPSRGHSPLVYDSTRGRVVLFGGQSTELLDDTWEYDGTIWTAKSITTKPAPRRRHALAFDRTSGRVILFGGQAAGVTNLRDTWEYDGAVWSEKVLPASPSAREFHGMTFDLVRNKTVMFGGGPSGGYGNDTWDYDGANWKMVSAPTTSPSPRFGLSLNYDPAQSRAVLFGGLTALNSTSNLNDTWEWDGIAWQARVTSQSPSARLFHATAFDPIRGKTLLLGGTTSDINERPALSDFWEYDGQNWQQVVPSILPPAAYLSPMALDAGRNRLVRFSGRPGVGFVSGTWEWDGVNWADVTPSTSPPNRAHHLLSYSSADAKVMLFGGDGGPSLTDTWTWNGAAWQQLSPATSPPFSEGGACALDSTRAQVLTFGGGVRGETTWAFASGQWQELTAAVAPPERRFPGLCYDSSRGVSVLFGGRGNSGTPIRGDTWELSSNRPPRLAASHSPASPLPGSLITLSATFSDPDGDTPTFRWLQTFGPRVMLNNATAATATFSTTIATSYGFQVVASDGREAYAYALGTVNVAQGNSAPVNVTTTASSNPALPGYPVELSATASDPDGDALVYTWSIASQPAGGDGALANATARTPTFTATRVGAYTLSLTVSDGRGGTASTGIVLTVQTPVGATFSTAASVPSVWGWVQRAKEVPEARATHALAFDPVRSRTVLFGGASRSTALGDTWEWDGSSWGRRSPTSSPSARFQYACAYDAGRRRVVLFGGATASAVLGDTWEWDGETWLRKLPLSSPQARSYSYLAYDSDRGRMVLYGGSSNNSFANLSDTWEWDGTTWVQLSPATGPGIRAGHGMAYDPESGRVLLYGGGSGINDTWAWNGSTWTQLAPAQEPSTVNELGMTLDTARRRIVLFGGAGGTRTSNETWEWYGGNWHRAVSATIPGFRGWCSLVYDSTRARTIFFGGTDQTRDFSDTWEYDGTNWKSRGSTTQQPPTRFGHGLARDPQTNRILLFGGYGGGDRADTWALDSLGWTQLQPGASPGPRRGALLTPRSSSRMLLFGGRDSSNFLNDSWEWVGTSWQSISSSSMPSGRDGACGDYDPARGRAVLFGGRTASGPSDETWEYGSTGWEQRAPASRPSQRAYSAAAFDSPRQVTLLFGGVLHGPTNTDTYFGDTWTWNGVNWRSRAPLTSPSKRVSSCAYDLDRQRIVLFGGTFTNGGFNESPKHLNDTWEWDGDSWKQLAPATSPAARLAELEYDLQRRAVVMFGDDSFPAETWELPSNRPPRLAAAFSPASPGTNDLVTLSAQFADQDGDSPSFRWHQTFGPRVNLNNSTSAVATFATSIATSYGFQVVASDGREGYAYALGTVTVAAAAPANRNPTASAGTAATINLGSSVTLSGLGSLDPDGDPLSFSWRITSSPAGSSLAPAAPSPNDSASAGTPSFTPDRAGSYVVTLNVTDGRGGSATSQVTISVNTPPTVSAGADLSATPNSTVTLAATAADADGNPLSYSWSQTAGAFVSIANPGAASISFIAPSAGLYTFRVTVTDGRGGSASDTVDVSITSPPLPDLVALSVSTVATRVEHNQSLAVTGSVRNSGQATAPACVAGVRLSLDSVIDTADPSIGSLPLFVLAPAQTAPLSGTFSVPASIAPTGYFLGLVADSSGAVAESSETNNAVRSASPLEIAPATVRIANLVARSVAGPSGARAGDAFQATALIENAGNLDTASTFALEFFLSTGASLGAGVVPVGADSVPGLPAGAQAQRSPRLTVPAALAPAAYRLIMRVDGANAVTESSESDNVTVSAQPIQVSIRPADTTPPTATLSFHPTQALTRPAVLTITATFDEPLSARPELRLASNAGQLVTTQMTQVSSASFLFQRAFSAADNGSYTVSLAAVDAAGNALVTQPANQSFAVQIAVNRPPTASAGSDRTARAGDTVQLAGSGSDPDGDRVTYAWTSSPQVALSNPAAPNPSFPTASPGRVSLLLAVSDGRGGVATDSVEITIAEVSQRATDLLQVAGVVMLESGEPPASGTRLLVRNTRLGTVQTALPDPETGAWVVTFEAASDAARSGDTLALTLENPDGSPRRIVRPDPATFFLTDQHIDLSTVAGLDVVGEGSAATGGVLVTLAGAGQAGFSGDAGAGVSALLNSPSDIAFDGAGNLYVADSGNGRVRRVAPNGTIATVAGNGKPESSGDGGQATAAGIGRPAAIALSSASRLYIADRVNHRIREVDLATGVITTLAGTGAAGFSGDGGAARLATLNQPRGLALAGTARLYVADSVNHRVREIDLASGVIRTVAGNGFAGFSADGGPATAASLNTPGGLAFDSQGRLLVTALNGHRVRRVDLAAGTIDTVAGTGIAGLAGDGGAPLAALLSAPARVVGRANGDMLLAERDAHRIRIVERTSNRIRTLAGTGQAGFVSDGTEAQRAVLSGPQGLATSSDGGIVFSDTGNHRVRRITLPSAPGADDHPDFASGLGAADTLAAGGAPVAGDVETGGDVDFFRFDATPGNAYSLETRAGTLGDTVLALFDRDGTRLLAQNDDFGGSRAARIDGFRPQVAGTYFARVQAFAARAVGTYTLAVSASALSNQPLVVTTGLPDATAGTPYGFSLEVAGGTAPYRWSVEDGALPPGLALDAPSGLLSGTPGAAGDFRFAVVAKDANGKGTSKPFPLAVRSAGIARFPESAHPYPGGLDETKTFRLGGFPAAIQVTFDPATFAEAGFDFIHVSDGAGRAIPGSPFTGGQLAGATRRVEGDTVQIRLVSDSNVAGFGYRVVDVSVAEAVDGTLEIGPAELPAAQADSLAFYSVALRASAAVPSVQWSLGSGTQLPRGLGLDTLSGVLSGRTTQAGDFAFVAKVRDSRGAIGSRRYVLPVLSVGGSSLPESLHPYADGSDDSQSYTLAGNPAGILVTFDSRSELETGLDFLHVVDAAGAPVSGSPFTGRELAGKTVRVPGASVRLRLVSDGSLGFYGYRVTRVIAVPASPPALAFVTPAPLPAIQLGASSAQTLEATGGVPPYRFEIVSGRVPPGLFLDPDSGVVQGAASASGAFGFRARVTDTSSAAANRDFSLTVAQGAPPSLTVTTAVSTGTFTAALSIDTPSEPLSSVTLVVAYDAARLANPRVTAGEAAGSAAVSLETLSGGELQVAITGTLTQGGVLARLEFDLLDGADPGRAHVTIASSELVTAEGQRLLLRPTADAGLDVSVGARYLSTGVLAPTIPDPLEPPESNGRPFVRLDGRESHDPNRPVLPLTYSWSQTGGTTVTLTGARTATPTFVPPAEGQYVFALTVHNGQFQGPADEVRVLVSASNSPPGAEIVLSGAGADGAYVAGRDTVVLDGSLSTDPDPLDARGLSYRWRQTKGRSVELVDASDGRTRSTTAPRVQFLPIGPGAAGFELVVTDPRGVASPPAAASLLVRPENAQLPRLSLLATATTTTDQGDDLGDGDEQKALRSLRVAIPTRVALKATVVDKDIGRPPLKQRLTFAWRQTGGPAVRLENALLANTDQLASIASFEPTTSRVHAFECRVGKLDENGNHTGVEVTREIRVIVDSEDNAVPEAEFEIIVEDGPEQPKRKTSFPNVYALSRRPVARPGSRVTLNATRSADPKPRVVPGNLPKPPPVRPPPVVPLLIRWTQVAGPPIVLSNPYAAITTFVVPSLAGDARQRALSFRLFVDDGRDRSEPVEGGLAIQPPAKSARELALRPGLNLLSLPLDPSTTGRPFTSEDLLSMSRASFVARVGEASPARFEVHGQRFGRAPFLIEGNRGYLLSAPRGPVSTSLTGAPWPPISRELVLERGLNVLALPAGIPAGYTAEDLVALTGASFVTRVGSAGRFEAYVPGAGAPFALEAGDAYLLSLPAARPVTLPAGE